MSPKAIDKFNNNSPTGHEKPLFKLLAKHCSHKSYAIIISLGSLKTAEGKSLFLMIPHTGDFEKSQ